MSVGFGSATHASLNSGGSTTTFSFTSTGEPLYVCIGHYDDSHSNLSGVTFNGSALTRVAQEVGASPGWDNAEVWRLTAPAATTANIVVDWSLHGSGASGGASAFNTTGQDHTSPDSGGVGGRVTAGATSISLSGFTVNAGDAVLAAVAWDASGAATGSAHAGSTAINFSTNSNTEGDGSLRTTNTTIQADFSASVTSAMAACVLATAGGGGGGFTAVARRTMLVGSRVGSRTRR